MLVRSSEGLFEISLVDKHTTGNLLVSLQHPSSDSPFLLVLGISQPCDLVRNDPIPAVGPNWLKQINTPYPSGLVIGQERVRGPNQANQVNESQFCVFSLC